MGAWLAAVQYIQANSTRFIQAVEVHLWLSAAALLIAAAICVPLGILTSRSRSSAAVALGIINTLRVIPSLAIILIVFPFLGLGPRPALLALIVLACPPILVNTDAGFRNVDPAIVEAARGMGMTQGQVLARVELPLALPVLLTGIRIALVQNVGLVTIAALIGAGGLGAFVFQGIGQTAMDLVLLGAIPTMVLAFSASILLDALIESIDRVRT